MSEKVEIEFGSSISKVRVKLSILKIHVVEIKFDWFEKPIFIAMVDGGSIYDSELVGRLFELGP